MILNDKQLVKVCAEWQEALKLGDWALEIRKTKKMDHDLGARVEWFTETHQAKIDVLHEDCYPDNCWVNQDMEHRIVHELLHIVLKDWDCEKDDPQQEWAVNRIASALVNAKRKTARAKAQGE